MKVGNIDSTIWSDPDFDEVDNPDVFLLYIYLTTCPEIPSTGIFRFSKRNACNDSRLSIERIDEAIRQLENGETHGKIMYDESTRWIWVKGLFGRTYKNIPHANLVINVWNMLNQLMVSDFPYWMEFENKYSDLVKGFQNSFKELKKTSAGPVCGPNKNKNKNKNKNIKGESVRGGASEMWMATEALKACQAIWDGMSAPEKTKTVRGQELRKRMKDLKQQIAMGGK